MGHFIVEINLVHNYEMKDLSVEYPMYFGAKPIIFKIARDLRRYETEAEKLLWSRLSDNQLLGLHFRRQHPINIFIADFYCPKIKLVIEVDGSIHDLPENKIYDIGRSDVLNDFGITVIRFSNNQIINSIDIVISDIEKYILQNLT